SGPADLAEGEFVLPGPAPQVPAAHHPPAAGADRHRLLAELRAADLAGEGDELLRTHRHLRIGPAPGCRAARVVEGCDGRRPGESRPGAGARIVVYDCRMPKQYHMGGRMTPPP